MTLWSVYHTLFGVVDTFTVSYITAMEWYPHFIFYSIGYQCLLFDYTAKHSLENFHGTLKKHENHERLLHRIFPCLQYSYSYM